MTYYYIYYYILIQKNEKNNCLGETLDELLTAKKDGQEPQAFGPLPCLKIISLKFHLRLQMS